MKVIGREGELNARPTTLRLALKANAAFSSVSGLALIALAGPLAAIVGIRRWVAFVIGVLLIFFALSLWQTATRPTLDLKEARAAVWADATWVVGSVVVALLGLLTPAGTKLTIAVALVVAAFAAWQYRALRELIKRGDG